MKVRGLLNISSISLYVVPLLIIVFLRGEGIATVSSSTIIFSIFDFTLTFWLAMKFVGKIDYRKLSDYTLTAFNKLYRTWFFWIFIFCYFAISNIDTFVSNTGHSRDEIMKEIKLNYVDLLFRNFIVILVGFSLSYSKSKKTIILFILLWATVLLATFSRSPIQLLIFLLLVINHNIQISRTQLIKIFSVVFAIVGVIALFQGRSETFVGAILNSLGALFRYRLSPYLLSEVVLNLRPDVDNYFFSFFGFGGEKFLNILQINVHQPISTRGSGFVYEFVKFDGGFRSNVLYPWWSWFVLCFGPLGLFVKLFFQAALLWMLKKYNLLFALVYLVTILIFLQHLKHPFINSFGFFSFVVLICIDIYVKFKSDSL